ncbi:hypothetical protein SMALA_0247 [Streptomyces malaysiensis subsp. malaysiensis]|nr:hypothetical protein SMALA_0247 [Streptomyces malaysiensis]
MTGSPGATRRAREPTRGDGPSPRAPVAQAVA